MKLYKIIIVLLLLVNHAVLSQTATIPDVNLRNKLISNYPSVMDGNELNTANAAALTGTLDLKNAAISDATGLEYFTGITTLNLEDNQLKTFPSVYSSTTLTFFFANRNQLTDLPDLSAWVNLKDFQVMENQLTELPNLPQGITSIYCTNNKITSFSNLTSLTNLSFLVAGGNPLNDNFDFSVYPNLTQLHVHQTNISKIVGLDQLKELEFLYAWGNQIDDFSGIDPLQKLKVCVIFDNPLAKIPFIENKPNLFVFNLNDCNLTFEDISPILTLNPSFTFNYSPQREVIIVDQELREKSSFQLRYPIENPLATNSYVWFKNSIKLDSSNSSTYTLNAISYEDEGSYSLKIYNQDIPDLELESRTFKLTVIPCLEFKIPRVDVIDKDCSKGYTIDLMNAVVSGGTAPYSYTLKNNNDFNDTYSTEKIENIPAGNYTVTITDAKKCTASDVITLNRIERCDAVFSPNGDGIADSFFIDKVGLIKIYDLKRTVIKTLTGPTTWDGSTNSGGLADAGYYIIIPEEDNTPIYITLIR